MHKVFGIAWLAISVILTMYCFAVLTCFWLGFKLDGWWQNPFAAMLVVVLSPFAVSMSVLLIREDPL